MDAPASASALVEILLTTGRTLALQLNEKLAVRVVRNAPLLIEWRGHDAVMPASLRALLEELLPSSRVATIMQQIAAAAGSVDEAGLALGTCALRVAHGGGPDRFATLSLHRAALAEGLPLLLLMRDATAAQVLQQTLAQARESLAAALAALRASPRDMRLFLSAAMASVGALRATMKLPARDQQAAHAKIAQLRLAAGQLAADARAAGLTTVVDACGNFERQLAALQDRPLLSGDDLLPLAPLLDRIASGVGDSIRIEEQRYVAAPPARAAAPAGADPADARHEAGTWARLAERRWNAFVRRRCEEMGTLVKLHVHDARLVPAAQRHDVDDMLQHLLRNALEHGIETPEQRLAADKPAAGEISVKFEDRGRAGLLMSVRDDGRGLDVERIGRAAVRSGLVSDESLLEYDPGEVVGLIFKPSFSTENLEGESGRGRGMNFLRRAVARLGGQITVATRPGRHTQFSIQLPAPVEAVSPVTATSAAD